MRRIALLAYPRLTFLDLFGVYDALRRVHEMGVDGDVQVRLIGTDELVTDDALRGVAVAAHGVFEPLDDFDLLVVPGGPGSRQLIDDSRFLEYLRTWGMERPVASVCTGALLLGAAGLLEDVRATTHHRALDDLRPFCREVVEGQRVVDEGRVVTSAGVTASIDLGLHLVRKHWGDAAHDRIATQMEYPTAPAAPA